MSDTTEFGPPVWGTYLTTDGYYHVVSWDAEPDYLRNDNCWVPDKNLPKRSAEFEEALFKCLSKITLIHDHGVMGEKWVGHTEFGWDKELKKSTETKTWRLERGVFLKKYYMIHTSTIQNIHDCASDFISGWDAATKIQRCKDKAAQDMLDAKKAAKDAKKALKREQDAGWGETYSYGR